MHRPDLVDRLPAGSAGGRGLVHCHRTPVFSNTDRIRPVKAEKAGVSRTSSLRGRGRSMFRISATWPGLGVITTTLSDRNTASLMLWVMKTTVFRSDSQIS